MGYTGNSMDGVQTPSGRDREDRRLGRRMGQSLTSGFGDPD